MCKVLITGPESSGKSFLAEHMAAHFQGVVVPEFARSYLENRPQYNQADLVAIARGQFEAETRAHSPGFLFCDTGIEVIYIWSKVKFGSVDPQITSLMDFSRYDLVLLCAPNIPWEFDPLRENPNDTHMLYKAYVQLLTTHHVSFKVIDAPINNRVTQGISFVQHYCKSQNQNP